MSLYYAAENHLLPRRRRRLTPLIASVALTAFVVAGRTRLGTWLRGYFGGSRRVRGGKQLSSLGDRRIAFGELREWLLGRSMAMIVDAFGPPRLMETGKATVSAVADAGVGSFWRSALWYYPIDRNVQSAMAIRFAGGVVQQVDFFELAAAV
jgi:hypothetical protein